ncbi:formate/nitrite transporter family protein, partial [Staphylococcus aureus]
FLIVVLGRMQLFTESTITAMLPLATKPSLAALGRTLRLWALVILANLAGTALVASAMAGGLIGDDALRAAMIAVSAKVMTLGAG